MSSKSEIMERVYEHRLKLISRWISTLDLRFGFTDTEIHVTQWDLREARKILDGERDKKEL